MDFLAGTNWADRRPSTNASLNLCERTTESAPNLHLLLPPAVCRKPTPTLPSSGAHLSRGDEIADDLNLVGQNHRGSRVREGAKLLVATAPGGGFLRRGVLFHGFDHSLSAVSGLSPSALAAAV